LFLQPSAIRTGAQKDSALLKSTSVEQKKSTEQNGSGLTTLRTYGLWFSKASVQEEMLTNEP